ncbi:hypothetical protein HZ326_5845 [Fusarium oxysporum f. sp. albedinis]|nr:hypothetical protein HZ326_5845 [Fusarium oxysporum f. sp. albedinis]
MNHRADLMPLLYSGSTACPDSQTAIASCDIQATDFDQRNALSYMIASKGQPTASNQLAGHKRNHISGGTKTPILHPPSARASNQFERTLSSRPKAQRPRYGRGFLYNPPIQCSHTASCHHRPCGLT